MTADPATAIPDPALVVLVGAAGSGKSTCAAKRYLASTVFLSLFLSLPDLTGPDDLERLAPVLAAFS